MPKAKTARKGSGKHKAASEPVRKPVRNLQKKYEVEVITKARLLDDGSWEYLVKWAGYGHEDDSWEPFENVRECTRLLNSFKEETGLADGADDHRVGHEVEASRAWIEMELKKYRTTYGPPKRPKLEEPLPVPVPVPVPVPMEKPPWGPAGLAKRARRKTKKERKAAASESESEDENQVPLKRAKGW